MHIGMYDQRWYDFIIINMYRVSTYSIMYMYVCTCMYVRLYTCTYICTYVMCACMRAAVCTGRSGEMAVMVM